MDSKPARREYPPSPEAERLRARLRAARGRWKDIADKTGIPYSTIQKIAQKVIPEPRLVVYLLLLGALDSLEPILDGSGTDVMPDERAT